MRNVEYSPLVRDKMLLLKEMLLSEYGEKTANKVLTKMIDDADNLGLFEESGESIAKLYDIDTDYWYLFSQHHYLVYRIEADSVIIVQMFHEREDFMMQLFGISGRTQESIDFWGE